MQERAAKKHNLQTHVCNLYLRMSRVGTALKQTFVYYFQIKMLECPKKPLETSRSALWFSNDLLLLETLLTETLLRASRAFLPAANAMSGVI